MGSGGKVLPQLKAAWEAYIRVGEKLKKRPALNLRDDKIERVCYNPPDTNALQKHMQDMSMDDKLKRHPGSYFEHLQNIATKKGKPFTATELLLLEMQRVMACHSKDCLTFDIFLLAAYDLFLAPSPSSCAWPLARAALYRDFTEYDLNDDKFLDAEEINALLKGEGWTEDDAVELRKQLEVCDVIHDGLISFPEYYLYRWLGEVQRVLHGKWFHPMECEQPEPIVEKEEHDFGKFGDT